MRFDVTLKSEQMRMACVVGCERRICALKKGYKERVAKKNRTDSEGWFEKDIRGAMGELVFSLLTGLDWDCSNGRFDTLGDFDSGDLKYEVKTARVATGSLIIGREPKPDRVYALITGEAPDFTLRGWIWGREWDDVKVPPSGNKRFWHAPQDRLHDPITMPGITW